MTVLIVAGLLLASLLSRRVRKVLKFARKFLAGHPLDGYHRTNATFTRGATKVLDPRAAPTRGTGGRAGSAVRYASARSCWPLASRGGRSSIPAGPSAFSPSSPRPESVTQGGGCTGWHAAGGTRHGTGTTSPATGASSPRTRGPQSSAPACTTGTSAAPARAHRQDRRPADQAEDRARPQPRRGRRARRVHRQRRRARGRHTRRHREAGHPRRRADYPKAAAAANPG